MVLKILVFLTLLHYSICQQHYVCSQRSVLLLLKRPAYDFSMNILERVAQENDAHFAFSPLSTWLQLNALAEGSRGRTLSELRAFTKHHRQECFKQKFARIINKMAKNLKYEFRRKSLIAVDKLLNVDQQYTKDVGRFYGIKLMLEDFEFPETAADDVNKFIAKGTSDVIQDVIYPDDFNQTVMVLSDNVFLKSAWKFPFNTAYTKQEVFSSPQATGLVNMMTITGYFNVTELPSINVKVLEIPCLGGFSMMIFMPLREYWIGDTFYNLKRTTLNTIFNRFKLNGEKLVTVKLPRFNVSSVVDNLPELLFDMGIKRVFSPILSEMNVSKYYSDLMYASIMTQASYFEITEKGVRANVTADFLVNETRDSEQFHANKPFSYLFLDRKTQFILFGGAYSVPSIF